MGCIHLWDAYIYARYLSIYGRYLITYASYLITCAATGSRPLALKINTQHTLRFGFGGKWRRMEGSSSTR
jgi:hypothetical protein